MIPGVVSYWCETAPHGSLVSFNITCRENSVRTGTNYNIASPLYVVPYPRSQSTVALLHRVWNDNELENRLCKTQFTCIPKLEKLVAKAGGFVPSH